MLKSLLQFLNRDLTGRSSQREIAHPYFTSLVYFGDRDVRRSYWEAEVPSSNGATFIAYLKSPPDGPSSAEEEFCRDTAAQLDELSAKCAPLVSRAAGRPLSSSMLRLESIEVPENGDGRAHFWDATFAVGDESFVVRMQHGEPTAVARDDDAG